MANILSRVRLSRRQVAAAAVVSAIAPTAVHWDEAEAYSYCNSFVGYDIENVRGYSAATWGEPRCDNACAYIESPNGNWWNRYCCACGPATCECVPTYIQARVGVTNSGLCSQRCGVESFAPSADTSDHGAGESQWTGYHP